MLGTVVLSIKYESGDIPALYFGVCNTALIVKKKSSSTLVSTAVPSSQYNSKSVFSPSM